MLPAVGGVVPVVVAAPTEPRDPARRVAVRLGRGDHVEGDGEGAPLVDVVHPQTRPRKLPLHVTVRLRGVTRGIHRP